MIKESMMDDEDLRKWVGNRALFKKALAWARLCTQTLVDVEHVEGKQELRIILLTSEKDYIDVVNLL